LKYYFKVYFLNEGKKEYYLLDRDKGENYAVNTLDEGEDIFFRGIMYLAVKNR
jgi:hypothetical protein